MSKCRYRPEKLDGKPIGMFHCPDCGDMVIAGMPHYEYDKLLDEIEALEAENT